MTAAFSRLLSLVDVYLATGDFWALWRPIAGTEAEPEPGPFAPNEESLWDELYEIVYMGQDIPASADAISVGLLGGAQLQTRLQEWREAALRVLAV